MKGRLELVSILRKTIFIQMDGIQIYLSVCISQYHHFDQTVLSLCTA